MDTETHTLFGKRSDHVAYARARKAARVASVLRRVGVQDPMNVTDEQWHMAEAIAEVRALSSESRATVVGLMSVG